jgi:hypothetical protein
LRGVGYSPESFQTEDTMPSKKRPGTKPKRHAAGRVTARRQTPTPSAVPRSGPRGKSGTRWKPGDPPRDRKAPRVLAPEVQNRLDLLRVAGKDITAVAEYLDDQGKPRTRQSVSDVIHRKWKYWHTNDDVIDAVCAVASCTVAQAWSDLPNAAMINALGREAERGSATAGV